MIKKIRKFSSENSKLDAAMLGEREAELNPLCGTTSSKEESFLGTKHFLKVASIILFVLVGLSSCGKNDPALVGTTWEGMIEGKSMTITFTSDKKGEANSMGKLAEIKYTCRKCFSVTKNNSEVVGDTTFFHRGEMKSSITGFEFNFEVEDNKMKLEVNGETVANLRRK